MDSFNPTTKTQAALTAALQAATSAGNPQVTPAHLVMALLTQNDGAIRRNQAATKPMIVTN